MEKKSESPTRGLQHSFDESESKTTAQQGRSLSPPPFQLTAQPIQRVVANKDGDEFTLDDVWQYIDEAEIEYTCKKGKIIDNFEEAMNSETIYSLEEFVEKFVPVREKKKEFEEACSEEKKGNKVKRTAAPNWVRETVYEKSKKYNPYYKGVNEDGFHSFHCKLCGEELALDNDGKEVGYETPNSKKKKQPPVCHGKDFPAAYVSYAISAIIENEGYDSTLLKHCPGTNSWVQALIWEVGLKEMFPGHISCNSSDKDPQWNDLSEMEQKKVIVGVKNYLIKNEVKDSQTEESKKRKDTSPTILQELCYMLDDFSSKSQKKDDEDDDEGKTEKKAVVVKNSNKKIVI